MLIQVWLVTTVLIQERHLKLANDINSYTLPDNTVDKISNKYR